MKEQVRVALVQFAPEWLQRERNAERMAAWAEKEAAEGAELIVFPELANIGHITPLPLGGEPCFDDKTTAIQFAVMYRRAAEPIPGPTTDRLAQVAKKWNVYIIVGMAQQHPKVPGTLFNAAAFIGPSGLIGVQHKVHIPGNQRFYFYPGVRPQVFDTGLGKIGISIGYDGNFFPEGNRVQALLGAEILVETTCVPGKPGNQPLNERSTPFGAESVTVARAIENQVYYLNCNRTGREGDVQYIGRSSIACPHGDIIAYAEDDREKSITAELYEEEVLSARAGMGVYRDRRPETYHLIVEPLDKATLSAPRLPTATKV